MRARMALHLAATEYEHREVLLRDKPEEMLEASPKGSVPVLVLQDGKVIDESLDIIRWALPDAKIERDITEMIDGPFKHHLDRYKYASRYDEKVKRGDVDLSHRAEAVRHLGLLESKLADDKFLCGAEFGPTDMASFPFVRQFAAVEPEWWADGSGLTRTRDWLAACLASELFQAIMQKHDVWKSEAKLSEN